MSLSSLSSFILTAKKLDINRSLPAVLTHAPDKPSNTPTTLRRINPAQVVRNIMLPNIDEAVALVAPPLLSGFTPVSVLLVLLHEDEVQGYPPPLM